MNAKIFSITLNKIRENITDSLWFTYSKHLKQNKNNKLHPIRLIKNEIIIYLLDQMPNLTFSRKTSDSPSFIALTNKRLIIRQKTKSHISETHLTLNEIKSLNLEFLKKDPIKLIKNIVISLISPILYFFIGTFLINPNTIGIVISLSIALLILFIGIWGIFRYFNPQNYGFLKINTQNKKILFEIKNRKILEKNSDFIRNVISAKLSFMKQKMKNI